MEAEIETKKEEAVKIEEETDGGSRGIEGGKWKRKRNRR